MNEKKIILDAAKKLYTQKLVAGTSGNISMRCAQDSSQIYITPSSLPYKDMVVEDIVKIDANGTPETPSHVPSSEWPMHLEVYKKYPHINAIVHTHAPFATAFAVNRQGIPLILVEMKPFLGGDIKVAPFAQAGSLELGKAILPYLEDRYACLLANHGTISCGKTMDDAYIASEYLEDAAKIYYYAKTCGSPVILE